MSEEWLTFEIPAELAGERLDKVIAQLYPDWSRTRAQTAIDDGHLLVNDVAKKASYDVREGDVISLWDEPQLFTSLVAENLPLHIVYEDSECVVVNKPRGMVVHPSVGHLEHTLVHALLYHFQHLATGSEHFRPGIVHRIDKDTSGLLVVAKTDLAHRQLSEAIKAHDVKRDYVALVHGVIKEASGTIKAPIGRHTTQRQSMAVVHDGKPAVTHFKVLERFSDCTLISCQLETGRTHQIRVHFSHIGYPIIGDPLYGKRESSYLDGQLLHARSLAFLSPSTKQPVEAQAPLPDYFEHVLTYTRTHGTWKGVRV